MHPRKIGKEDLVAAHGNSIRALVKYLDHVPDDEITGLNIPTGFPLVYELDDDLHPVRHYYLGDPEEISEGNRLGCKPGRHREISPHFSFSDFF